MTSTHTTEPAGLIEHHPALDDSRRSIALPVTAATLLEDRAQIVRTGLVDVTTGRNRLVVFGVAPVVQDVSLRAAALAEGVRVDDARVRRAVRTTQQELPAAALELEARLTTLGEERQEHQDDLARVSQRAAVIDEMMVKALEEVPEDAAWSIGDAATWKQTFETLSTTSRTLLSEQQRLRLALQKVNAAIDQVAARRAIFDRPDHRVLALVELDVFADVAGRVELQLEYTVPNAIWRPTHEAVLSGGQLKVTSRAAVWQNTGEDWHDIHLSFSTARSSLGHEPPLLSDDLLNVAKKDQRVVVAAREVAVSSAGLGRGGGGGGGGGPRALDLPGVDDGGDVQLLRAANPLSVPSDGRPCFVPIAVSTSPAKTSLVVMGEVEQQAIIKATAAHAGSAPLLAGPVDLLRDSGPAGATRTLFIAPGEQLALSFGPDDDVRVRRRRSEYEELDEVDRWRRLTVHVDVALSNLGGDDKRLEVVERVPVSEIEHVKITIDSKRSTGGFVVDSDGFVRWSIMLAARSQERVHLFFVTAYAPGVAS